MDKLCDGETFSEEKTTGRVREFVQKWQNNNLYSHLAVFEKSTDEFLGSVRLHDCRGKWHRFHNTYWRKDFGTEAAIAVVKHLAPALRKEKCRPKGESLREIIGTARKDNPGSVGIMQKIGMTQFKTEERYDQERLSRPSSWS